MRQRLAGKRCSNLSSMFFIYADSWQAVKSCRKLSKATFTQWRSTAISLRCEALRLVVVDHVLERLVELIGRLLDLQLLPVDLVLDVVNSLVELRDVHLSVLKPGFGSLVLGLEHQDFVNQLLFPLEDLDGRVLEQLHVLTDAVELVFNILQVLFSELSSLDASLQFDLLHAQLP